MCYWFCELQCKQMRRVLLAQPLVLCATQITPNCDKNTRCCTHLCYSFCEINCKKHHEKSLYSTGETLF